MNIQATRLSATYPSAVPVSTPQVRIELDRSQMAFCRAADGNVRLLAPAGCGKTLALVYRCAHLARISPNKRPRFLVLTFTVAAKQELESRIDEMPELGHLKGLVEVSTLNSWGFRRVRNISLNPRLVTTKADKHFAVFNQIQTVWKQHPYVRKAIERRKNDRPREILDIMDSFKAIGFDHVRHVNKAQFEARVRELQEQGMESQLANLFERLVKAEVLERTTGKDGVERVLPSTVYSNFYKFWRDATATLIGNDTFTFEDQKYAAYLDEQQKYEDGAYLTGATRYDYVLIDEFQDINPLDLALIRAIAQRNKAPITIVGDDDQAIFEWRGATPEYILDPERFFAQPFTTFTLNSNYRSPANIVALSQNLIQHNSRRVAKKIRSKVTHNADIEVMTTDNLIHSMELVNMECQRFVDADPTVPKIAIIGRKRSQIIPYQLYFASQGIPFCAAEDLQIFMSSAFDRLLKLVEIKSRGNHGRRTSQIVEDLLDLCNLVKRYQLSKSDRQALSSYVSQNRPTTLHSALDCMGDYRGPLKGTNADGRMSRTFVTAIRRFLDAPNVADTIHQLAAHFDGLQYDLGKAEDDIFFVDPPFLHLADYSVRYGDDYEQFVADIDLAKQQLVCIPQFHDDSTEMHTDAHWKRPVHLMTAPRSKGKEFDTVVLLDCNEGIWPHRNAQTATQIEEERRVFYVAFTRVKKRILILMNRSIRDRQAFPSPFLAELGDVGGLSGFGNEFYTTTNEAIRQSVFVPSFA